MGTLCCNRAEVMDLVHLLASSDLGSTLEAHLVVVPVQVTEECSNEPLRHYFKRPSWHRPFHCTRLIQKTNTSASSQLRSHVHFWNIFRTALMTLNHLHNLIMKDSERNHSMGRRMDGTPPQFEDWIDIVRSKTICAVTIQRPLKWQIVFDLTISIWSSDRGVVPSLGLPML